MLDNLKYRKPNFNREWLEAVRYPEFQEIGRLGWLEIAQKGHVVNYSDIKDSLGNVDLDFDSLERDKKVRFIEAYKNGVIETPIAVSFGGEYDLLAGNTRLSGLIKLGHDPKIWVVNVPNTLMEKWSKKYKDSIDCSNPKGFSQRAHCQGKKKQETKEMTGADSSGSYVGAASITIKKKDFDKINNWDTIKEALDASAYGEYDVPFLGTTSKGRKNPLGIEGPESVKKSRAVKDKKFPKWGGPGGIFIKIKEKCKKYPYCNQGDINAIEILRESIDSVSKETRIPRSEIEIMVLNEFNKIFI